MEFLFKPGFLFNGIPVQARTFSTGFNFTTAYKLLLQ